MKQRNFWAALLSVAIGLVASSNSLAQESGGIKDREAPELDVNEWVQLPDGEKSFSLEQHQGKVVYLYFFQSWCPGCHRTGFPTLKNVSAEFAGDDQVAFAAIQTTFEGHTTNTPAKALECAEKFELELPFGHAGGKKGTPKIMKDYRSRGTPWTIIIGKDGKVKFNDFHIQPEDAVTLINELKQAEQ